jgi:hypothetical protein
MPSESTPSIAALLIGLMPFAAMCFSVSLIPLGGSMWVRLAQSWLS